MATDYARALGGTAARHPHPAGTVPARRRGEVRGPLEGRRRRLLRARRPGRDRAAAGRAGRLLRRSGRRAAARTARPSGAAEPPPRLVLDLERLPGRAGREGRPAGPVRRDDPGQRGDYNGRVLSIRQDDLRTLAVIYDESPSAADRAADQLGRAQPRGAPRAGLRARRLRSSTRFGRRATRHGTRHRLARCRVSFSLGRPSYSCSLDVFALTSHWWTGQVNDAVAASWPAWQLAHHGTLDLSGTTLPPIQGFSSVGTSVVALRTMGVVVAAIPLNLVLFWSPLRPEQVGALTAALTRPA